MHPAYFALVMATGVVSLACEPVGLHPIAIALFALNLGFYPLLWALSIARWLRHRVVAAHDDSVTSDRALQPGTARQ